MDPTTVFCPHVACPASGQAGQGHSRLHSRQDHRFVCPECHRTFTATTGPAVERLQTPTATVTLVVTLMAPGCPRQAIVVACGVEARTVAAGGARAGRQGQAVQESLVEQPPELGQVQAEASRVTTPGGLVWMALAMLVKTRRWRAGAVRTRRDRPRLGRLSTRGGRGAAYQPLWGCTDGGVAEVRASRETCRDPPRTGAHGRPRLRPWSNRRLAQVVKREEPRRIVAVERRIVEGTPVGVETLRRRAPGDGGITTADLERLNATFRERLASVTRRGRALARRPRTLPQGMSLIGSVDHFCTSPTRLRLAASAAGRRSITRTPAMAAGIPEQGWTVPELRSLQGPPPRWTPPTQRGRPARALKRLIARWGS